MTRKSKIKLHETTKQPYADFSVSAGLVEGHEVDTIYLKMDHKEKPVTLLLREDEALAIVWCLTGAVWCCSVQDHKFCMQKKLPKQLTFN